MRKIKIIMSLCVSLSISFAANVESFHEPDFVTIVLEQDKQGNWKEMQVEVYGQDMIISDGSNAMIVNLNMNLQNKGWNLVDICNDAVADFLHQLESKRHVLIEDAL